MRMLSKLIPIPVFFALVVGCESSPPPQEAPIPKTEVRKTSDGKEVIVTSAP